VDVIESGPQRVWVRWTYFCVHMQDDSQPRLRGTEVVGYSTQPVELFGVAPVGLLIKDLFPRDAERGDYRTHAVLDLYSDRRYDIYWDEQGQVRRRGDDATLAAISRSPGCALVLPFREKLLFAVLGQASGFPAAKSQLIDHCTPGAEGGAGWGAGLWDHWPIGWLNSQTSYEAGSTRARPAHVPRASPIWRNRCRQASGERLDADSWSPQVIRTASRSSHCRCPLGVAELPWAGAVSHGL
jgi:hypothetical protein